MSKETIRTVAAVIAVLVALYTAAVQTMSLHTLLKYHTR